MMKRILILLAFCSFLIRGNSQGAIGLHAGPAYFFGNSTGPSVGLIGISPSNFSETVFQYALNYHPPIKVKGSDFAIPINNSNNEPSIVLPYTNKIKLFDFDICGRKYFGKSDYDDGGVYGLIGFSLGYGATKITPEPFDETKYRLSTFFFDPSSSIIQLSLSLGAGYDKVLANNSIIGAQIYTNLNIKKLNSTGGEQYIPSYVGIRGYFAFRN
jgi:hypothetical protein